ncbi:MAG: hypothetical protein EOM22_00295 [Gammaproteobacteria bacterium]|nr:hypothetical protein [Gammaproteobacteria bacterium]
MPIGSDWLNAEFLAALLCSPTAWIEIGGRGALLLLALGLTAWLVTPLLRVGGLRELHRRRDASASVVGFVLVMPFILVLVLVFAQLTMLLNKALLVHYAAYSAARSARVWMWDFDPFDWRVRLGGRFYVNPAVLQDRGDQVRAEVEAAARFALIPAAPVSGPTDQGGAVPDAVLRRLAQAGGLAGRAEVLIRQARYAFDPANSQIAFTTVTDPRRPDLVRDLTQPGDAWPVHARVRFRARLDLPVVRFFGSAGGDGDWYTAINAEMVLL